jgi:glycosyltransferase involved in cell wall biosynthesis
MERADLCTAFLRQPRNADILECGDAVGEIKSFMPEETSDKQAGELRVVFLSRITRNKNLAYALRLLHGIAGRVLLDIYGPQEHMAYWAECESLMRSLPRNIVTRYCGVVEPQNVEATFARYHLFLFPSAGESFGHVIREAICAGCPVMTSDRTPWLFDQGRGGWCIPLSAPDRFCTELQRLVWMDGTEYAGIRNAAMQLGEASVAAAQRRSKELAVAFHQLATISR